MKTLYRFPTINGGHIAFYLENVLSVELLPPSESFIGEDIPVRTKVIFNSRTGGCNDFTILDGGEDIYWSIVNNLNHLNNKED